MTLHQIADNYPKHVRIVFKHYPLSFHAQADVAHMASVAAGEQGKFWEMYDRIFGITGAKETISREKLLAWAGEIKLDMKKFEAALQREEKNVVDAALGALAELGKADEGRKLVEAVQPVSRGKIVEAVKPLGLAGFDAAFRKRLGTKSPIDEDILLVEGTLKGRSTPAFYVNGTLVKGAKPYEEFRKLIDEELKKKGLEAPPTAGDPPKPYLQKAMAAANPPPPPETPTNVGDVPVGTSPVMGKADAPVTIAEVSDFQ